MNPKRKEGYSVAYHTSCNLCGIITNIFYIFLLIMSIMSCYQNVFALPNEEISYIRGCEQNIDLFIATSARHIFSKPDNIFQDNTKIQEPYVDKMLSMQKLFFFLYCWSVLTVDFIMKIINCWIFILETKWAFVHIMISHFDILEVGVWVGSWCVLR